MDGNPAFTVHATAHAVRPVRNLNNKQWRIYAKLRPWQSLNVRPFQYFKCYI